MLLSSFKSDKLQSSSPKTSATLSPRSKNSPSNAAAFTNITPLQTALKIFTLPIPLIAFLSRILIMYEFLEAP